MRSSSKLALVAALLLGSAAQAGEHNFVLTAYTNGRGGQALISGDYDSASKALDYQPTLSAFDTSTNSNNRCVTLTVTRQWDAARSACDEAVKDAERERAAVPTFESWARNIEDDYVAVALSNRAVLHWMSAEGEAAAADLKRAAWLAPKSAFVRRNQSALEYAHHTLARLDDASR